MSQSHNAPPSPVLHRLSHNSDQFGVVSLDPDIDGVVSSLSIGTVAPVDVDDFGNGLSVISDQFFVVVNQ